MIDSIQPQTPVVKSFTVSTPIPKSVVWGMIIFVLILGSATGYLVAKLKPSSSTSSNSVSKELIETDTKTGIMDKVNFPDIAKGVLREGGSEGEGSYHLERGAKDQTAYLTSSTIDLSPFIGKKVSIWGKTYASQKVGWLLDVGYIEIVQ